jgi:hypothetical protein
VCSDDQTHLGGAQTQILCLILTYCGHVVETGRQNRTQDLCLSIIHLFLRAEKKKKTIMGGSLIKTCFVNLTSSPKRLKSESDFGTLTCGHKNKGYVTLWPCHLSKKVSSSKRGIMETQVFHHAKI